ncbi:MAG: hypothetical protein J0I20_13030 [Chloroflexi bacterium]|nr:hypothetical protein [Chloroflexota bacterium]OJV92604.1 MAG: hypothetical protein BGO39_32540 [Chloroflexi bacterium 54-19]
MKKSKLVLPALVLSLVTALLLSACGDTPSAQGTTKGGATSGVGAVIPGLDGNKGTPGSGGTKNGGSGSSAATGSGRNVDGCTLVTTEDVAPYIKDKFTTEKSGGDCTYTSEGLPPTVLLVSAEKGDAEDFQIRKKVFTGLGTGFAEATEGPLAGAGDIVGISANVQDLPGLGDEAFWTGGFLVFRKNDNIVMLTFIASFGLEQPKLDVLKDLSQKALARL